MSSNQGMEIAQRLAINDRLDEEVQGAVKEGDPALVNHVFEIHDRILRTAQNGSRDPG